MDRLYGTGREQRCRRPAPNLNGVSISASLRSWLRLVGATNLARARQFHIVNLKGKIGDRVGGSLATPKLVKQLRAHIAPVDDLLDDKEYAIAAAAAFP